MHVAPAPAARSYTTHASLLAHVAAGVDAEAWIEFHRRYAELIRGFARRQGLQPADCDDVTQEVLVALARALPDFTYDRERGRFRGYLKTIAIRTISRRFRQNRGVVALGDGESAPADPADGADARWEDEWRRHHVRRAMRRLEPEFSERDRAAFTAYALDGRPVRDVAAAFDMSRDQVYQAKSRITRRLKELVEEQIADEG